MSTYPYPYFNQRYNWQYTSQPEEEPVSVDTAIAQVRADDETESSLITSYITAARLYAEGYMGKTLVQRNVQATFYYSHQHLNLPRGPVQSITSIVDANDNTIDSGQYELRQDGNTYYVYFTGTVPNAPITVQYLAGYGEAADVPGDISLGILLHVATLYSNRESVSEKTLSQVPNGLECIYDQYRASELVG
jgi:uncharacterized phiE125 gp8 family phage protein